MEKIFTIESLVKQCLENGITISGVELCNNELAYYIDGVSKSGCAFLYEEDGKVYLKTRYEQIDEIETFEDIANVAYQWNTNYCNVEPFCVDSSWFKVFKRFGWPV